jgi:diguanylate cyclase (GGDEF)-like protein
MYRHWIRQMRRLLWRRRGFALVIFDCDRMLSLNAYAGHGKGDQALKQVAFEVRRALPKEGRAYRYSGDEFAVLLPDMNEQQGYAWAETVRKAVEAEVKVVDRHLDSRSLTVRAAVTEHIPSRRLWSKKDQTPLIMATNGAIVEARLRGGNCVVTRSVATVLESKA